jgi:hypothetical protein
VFAQPHWTPEEVIVMSSQELLTLIEEGLEHGRISPHLAAYIAAELLGVEAHVTGFDDRIRLDAAVEQYES